MSELAEMKISLLRDQHEALVSTKEELRAAVRRLHEEGRLLIAERDRYRDALREVEDRAFAVATSPFGSWVLWRVREALSGRR